MKQQRLIPGEDEDPPNRKGQGDRGSSYQNILTVTALTRKIKALLCSDPGLQSVSVVGEVLEVSTPSSGHMYFSLKDENTLLQCVMWRSRVRRVKFKLEKGLRVIVTGNINVYERQGKYQLYADRVRPEGKGALHLAFEQLKKKLEKEGLLERERKRSLPGIPERVGVVTSPTGAAIRDIIRVATERWPLAHLIVAPASVQGASSKTEVASAIGVLNTMGEVDVIIVSRGGGGLEDLWSFNEEVVARAIASSDIPVVTGIGHEVDVTIADLVADRTAATPSQAAELVFPDAREMRSKMRTMAKNLVDRLRSQLQMKRKRYDLLMASRALQRPTDLIGDFRQTVDELRMSLDRALTGILDGDRHRLALIETALKGLDPKAVLKRGYSITFGPDQSVIKDPSQLDLGDDMEIVVHGGEIRGRVEELIQGDVDGEGEDG